ncbi:BBP7 family outer membrane beta-barrel protein [Rubripirellula sp.]|nr:BBP7 family outer membrane beta-barrel protein [Rubripirellula sp.]
MSFKHSIKPQKYRWRWWTIVVAVPLSLVAISPATGQITGKTPDRSVYQPPTIVVSGDGTATLVKANTSPEFRPAPMVKPSRESNTANGLLVTSSSREPKNTAVVYGHLPRPVVSNDEQAKKFLKPGEEGNLNRPLMEVAVEDSDDAVSNYSGERSAQKQENSMVGLASYIRQESSRRELSSREDSIEQVGHQSDSANSNAAVSSSENGGIAEAGVISSASSSSTLNRLTRFATLPLWSHRGGEALSHDSTCDGCDACGPVACDSIGCGIFGCDQSKAECDMLGCDSFGPLSSQRAGVMQSLRNHLSSGGTHGSRSAVSHESPWFGGVEYLMMWRRGVRLPTLLSTEVTDGTATREEVLVGGDRIMTRMTSGVRFTTGRWMNRQQTVGFVGRGWYGGRKQYHYAQDQSQTPILLRPFLDYTDQFTPTSENQVIAEPGRANGSVLITGDSEAFGADLSFRHFLGADYGATLDLLYGYQFVRFNEHLAIQTNSLSLDDDFAPVGSSFAVSDSFQTSNEFHGAQLGLQTEYREGFWSFHGLAKLAFGSLHREALRVGETTVQVDSLSTTEPEGLLVRDTNSGRITNQQFSWVPEIDATLGWHRYQGWDLTLGYHLLAVTDAIQPCGAIDPDLGVNLSEPFSGAARPSADLRYRTFYLHGIHFGLQRIY